MAYYRDKATETQIKVAVEWWKGVMRRQAHPSPLGEASSSEETRHQIMAEGLMAFGQNQIPDPTGEQLERFGEILGEYLRGKMLEHKGLGGKEQTLTWRPCDGLHVDYDPCLVLSAAAEQAGIKMFVGKPFPTKTNMFFALGGVKVSYGYAAEAETLLAQCMSPEDVCEAIQYRAGESDQDWIKYGPFDDENKLTAAESLEQRFGDAKRLFLGCRAAMLEIQIGLRRWIQNGNKYDD